MVKTGCNDELLVERGNTVRNCDYSCLFGCLFGCLRVVRYCFLKKYGCGYVGRRVCVWVCEVADCSMGVVCVCVWFTRWLWGLTKKVKGKLKGVNFVGMVGVLLWFGLVGVESVVHFMMGCGWGNLRTQPTHR